MGSHIHEDWARSPCPNHLLFRYLILPSSISPSMARFTRSLYGLSSLNEKIFKIAYIVNLGHVANHSYIVIINRSKCSNFLIGIFNLIRLEI